MLFASWLPYKWDFVGQWVFFQQVHCWSVSTMQIVLIYCWMTLKVSLGEKSFHRCAVWIREETLNSMFPNSGLFKILIVVIFWMVQDGYFYRLQCSHSLSNWWVVPIKWNLFEDPKFCSWPSHYRRNLL